MKIEEILPLTQKQLFEKLKRDFKGAQVSEDKYIFVKGELPILLVAHLDTVHKEPVRRICTSRDGNILMSPEGIGGDDRCGVYALYSLYERSKKKPWLLFTCDEEIGGIGADEFVTDILDIFKENAPFKAIIEIDRQGSDDAVYYDCENNEFEDYITSKGFVTNFGSFSDISLIAPDLGVAAVNLSSGYYNQHTKHEYIVKSELESTIEKVLSILDDAKKEDFPKYEYVRKTYRYDYTTTNYGYSHSKNYALYEDLYYGTKDIDILPKLTPAQQILYDELLVYYTTEELDEWRRYYGNEIVNDLYDDLFEEKEYLSEKEMYKYDSEYVYDKGTSHDDRGQRTSDRNRVADRKAGSAA